MRIAIVNDATLAIEAVRRVVLESAEHEIAWVAVDGNEAVERCSRDTPDLVLMDLIMPGSNGVEATRQIMARCPCAILVVTASVMDNCSRVFEALGAGALDAVNTPVLAWPDSCKGTSALLVKIETIRKLIRAEPRFQGDAQRPHSRPQPRLPGDRLIVIGSSAGGPSALARILAYLPAGFPAAVVLVQHVDSEFAAALANWLGDQTPLRVRLAQDGDCPSPGTILLAGGDHHLVFAGRHHLTYIDQPEDCSYRPSVDVFFNSIRHHWPAGGVIGVLLTGMGRDGAQGLRALRQNGHHTVAQDQASCAVYGMPKAAVELDAATEVLSLDQIGLRLRTFGEQEIRPHA